MAQPLVLPDPPLHDRVAGVVLRPWRPGDAAALVAAWADPEVTRWTAVPERRDRASAERWITGAGRRRAAGVALDLVVAGEVDDGVRGEVGLTVTDAARRWAEVGYWAAAPWRGTGSTTAAVGVVVRWALGPATDLAQVYARTDLGNPRSGAVAHAAGLTQWGTLDDGRVLWVTRR